MKIKVGNKTMTLSRDVIASHMANLLTTRAIISNQEKDFKESFYKHKELCLAFLKENKKFVFTFGDDSWLKEFIEYQNQQVSLLMQDVFFKFSDGATWSICLNDIANLKMLQEPEKKYDKKHLLTSAVELVDWAQKTLTWDQVQSFAVLRHLEYSNETYTNEWVNNTKKIIKWQYGAENQPLES